MKKCILSFVLLMATCHVYAQHQMQVSERRAVEVATNFLISFDSNYAQDTPQIYGVYPYKKDKYVALYEVIFADSIEVIVAGSHSSRPILAVVPAPSLTPISMNPEEFPLGFVAMFQRMIHEQAVIFDSLTTFDTAWYRYHNGIMYGGNNQMGPLLNTEWGQSYVERCGCREYYNKYMPYSNGDCTCGADTTKYPSGCTVTAFGQVMNYWKYPVLVIDAEEQFDWCNMPDKLRCSDTAGSRLEAVSRMMKILGDDFGMSYGTVNRVIDWFIADECFGYLSPRDALEVAQRKYGYSEDAYVLHRTWVNRFEDWDSIIKGELDLGRPVIFYAFDGFWWGGAHTFVCDGYDGDNGLFHFNWGHGDAGGWCSLWEIVEDEHSWNYDEGAVFGFQPASLHDMCDNNLDLGVFYYGYYLIHGLDFLPEGALNPQPYEITPQTMTTLVSAHPSMRSDFRMIPSGETAVYRAHQEIILQDGFEAEWGSDFTAEIVPCPACEDPTIVPIHPIFDSLFPLTQTGGDSIDVVGDVAYSHMKNSGISRAAVFPNPTDGQVTVATDGEVEAIVIYTADGRPVGGWKILSLSGDHVTLDVSILPDGLYVLSLRTMSGTAIHKLTKMKQ